METFKFNELDSEKSWFFISMITDLDKQHAVWNGEKDITVEVKVNGEDVPFGKMVDRIMAGRQEYIEKRAAELVDEKCNDLFKDLEQVQSIIQLSVTKKVRELFPLGVEDDSYNY